MRIINPLKYSWQSKSDKFFYFAILLLIVASVLYQIEGSLQLNLPLIRYGIYALSTYYLFLSIRHGGSLKKYSGVSYFFLSLLLIIQVITIARGFPELFLSDFNYVNIKRFLSGQFLLFLLPLILFLEPNLILIKRLFKIIFLLTIVALIILVFNLPGILSGAENKTEGYIRFFAAGAGILLLTFPYHSKRVNRVVVLTLLISTLFMLLEARRNMVLYFSSIFFFTGFVIIFTRGFLAKKGKFSFAVGTFLVAVFGFFVYLIFVLDFSLFFERVDSGFESREGVINEMTNDFNSTPNDWYLGRGMTGTFFSMIGTDEFGFAGKEERELIENGYYQIILKSGLIYLILFILISLTAAFKGFFRSNNLLSKAAASLLIVNLIDMIGYGVPELALKYVFIWISFIICFSSYTRSIPDINMKELIGLK